MVDTVRLPFDILNNIPGVSGVEAVEFVEYGEDYIDSTRYAIESASLSVSAADVTVDPERVALGTVVDGPAVTVDSYTVGVELSEDSK